MNSPFVEQVSSLGLTGLGVWLVLSLVNGPSAAQPTIIWWSSLALAVLLIIFGVGLSILINGPQIYRGVVSLGYLKKRPSFKTKVIK